jgi:hypothetical protein
MTGCAQWGAPAINSIHRGSLGDRERGAANGTALAPGSAVSPMVDSGVYRLLMLSTGYFAVTLVLMALRIADIVSWHWIWVLCPFWAPFALTGIAFASLILLRLVRPDTGRPPPAF